MKHLKIILFLLLAVKGTQVMNAYDFMVDGLCYLHASDGTSVWVTSQNSSFPSYSNLSGVLEIPSSVTYNGKTYSVTGISGYAFYDCDGLTEVTIGNSVKSISNYAFKGCTGLTSVTIPNSVTSIGENAFKGCTGLTSVVWNAKTCKNFNSSNYPFVNSNKINSFIFGNEVEKIPAYLCYGLNGLAEVTIPNSAASIGGSAFSGCTGLTSVTIPNSVTTIGDGAFKNCGHLKSITIPNSVTSIGNSAFKYCNGLKEVNIPNSVTKIGGYAFSGCTGLTSVTIPNSVTSIGDLAFYECTGLTSVTWNAKKCGDFTSSYYPFKNLNKINCFTFGNEVEKIPAYLCYGLTDLTSVTIPNSVTEIGTYAFSYCSGLTEATIGNSVTSIGSYAFERCTKLTSVTIGNSMTSIGEKAFYFCTSLTSITIPNSVTTIGESAFCGCTGLASLTIGDSVSMICRCAFYNTNLKVILSTNVTPPFVAEKAFDSSDIILCVPSQSINLYRNRNNLSSFSIIPFDFINNGLCYQINSDGETVGVTISSDNLSGSITIPSNVTFSGKNYSVTSIGEFAFYNKSITGFLTIPSTITSVGNDAFNCCRGLNTVNWNAKICTDLSRPAFINTPITQFIFGNTVEIIPANLCHSLKDLTSVIIPNSVTTIGDYAFDCCTGLTSVTIPNSVNYLSGFSSCSSLTSVTIPNSVTEIGNFAFYDCDGLAEVNIPNSVTKIGESAFSCSGLKSVNIGRGVTTIKASAFSYCHQLDSVTIPNNVHFIGSGAFSKLLSSTDEIGINRWSYLKIEDGPTELYLGAGCPFGRTDTLYLGRTFHCYSPHIRPFIDMPIRTLIVGKTVAEIKSYEFSRCRFLTTLIINDGNSELKIGGKLGTNDEYDLNPIDTFKECPIQKIYQGRNLSLSSAGDDLWNKNIKYITYGDSVTRLMYNTYWNRGGQLTNIRVKKGNPLYDSRDNCNAVIKTATNTLVYGCKNTIIPNSVTEIGKSAFEYCNGLKEVNIPNSVTSIGNYAFYDSGLVLIHSLNMSPPEIFSSTFSNYSATLYVPKGSKLAYTQHDYWKKFYNIEEKEFEGIDNVVIDSPVNPLDNPDDIKSIYTIDGRRLNPQDVSWLPNGIYIINGKKVLIKR